MRVLELTVPELLRSTRTGMIPIEPGTAPASYRQMTCAMHANPSSTPADSPVFSRARALDPQPGRAVGARGWAHPARRAAALVLCAGACALAHPARAAEASPDASGEQGAPAAGSDASEVHAGGS